MREEWLTGLSWGRAIEMSDVPTARRVVVLSIMLLVGLSLAALIADAEIATAPPPYSVAASASSSTSSSLSGTNSSSASSLTATGASSTHVGKITITAPAAGTTVDKGQTVTISGFITPAPTQPDRVLIVANQFNAMPIITTTVSVGQNGTFDYSTTAGAGWTPGFYIITVTDINGLSGTASFTIGQSSS